MGKYGLFGVVVLALVLGSTDLSLAGERNKGPGLVVSTDLKKLKSDLESKFDPDTYAIVVYGIRWKEKALRTRYPFTGVLRYVPWRDRTGEQVFISNSPPLSNPRGPYKFGESDVLTVFLLFAETRVDPSYPHSAQAVPEAFEYFRLAGFLSPELQPFSLNGSIAFPIKPGLIEYLSNFAVDKDPNSPGESLVVVHENSNETGQWIGKTYPVMRGFKFGTSISQ